MTQTEKELLLKDLCARLPYGVKCEVYNCIGVLDEVTTFYGIGVTYSNSKDTTCRIDECKPYLFPLSSMTREQLFEVQEILGKNEIEIGDGFLHIIDSDRNTITYLEILALLEWFYKNHFDVYGLIPMGLAIDATNLKIY